MEGIKINGVTIFKSTSKGGEGAKIENRGCSERIHEYRVRREKLKRRKGPYNKREKSRSTGSKTGIALDQNLEDCARRSIPLLYTSAFALRQFEAIGADNLLTPLKLQVLH